MKYISSSLASYLYRDLQEVESHRRAHLHSEPFNQRFSQQLPVCISLKITPFDDFHASKNLPQYGYFPDPFLVNAEDLHGYAAKGLYQ